MHESNKLWITFAVFIVVTGLLLGMYFTASPDKLLKNPERNQQKKERVKNEDTSARQTELDQKTLPGRQKQTGLAQETKNEDDSFDNGNDLKDGEEM